MKILLSIKKKIIIIDCSFYCFTNKGYFNLIVESIELIKYSYCDENISCYNSLQHFYLQPIIL